MLHEGVVRNLRKKFTRLQASRDEAKAALKAQTQSTQGKVSGFLTIDCLVKVCLASPMVSSWALYRAFRDVNGLDKTIVSMGSMSAIRDAWVEFLKEMHVEEIRRAAADLWRPRVEAVTPVAQPGARRAAKAQMLVSAAATRRPGPAAAGAAPLAAGGASPARPSNALALTAIALSCLHDEAEPRLRSLEEGRTAGSTRSRHSKIQQHVVRLFTKAEVLEYPTELEPLANKKATTIATSLDQVLRGVCKAIAPSFGAGEVC